MFFLGISAHLFIYLLVPAFLVVCFYFKGIAGHPETSVTFPEAIVYEHITSPCSEKTYIYQVQKQQKLSPSKAKHEIEFIVQSVKVCFPPIFYLSPAVTFLTLRAPPVSLV